MASDMNAMSTMSSMKPPSAESSTGGPILNIVSQIGDELSNLDRDLVRLSDKIRPIMNPDTMDTSPAKMLEGDAIGDAASPLYYELTRRLHTIEDLRRAVQDMESRAQL